MAASAIFILDGKSKVIIARNYRGDVPMSMATKFIARALEEDELIKPIVNEEGVTYVFVKHNGLFCTFFCCFCLFYTNNNRCFFVVLAVSDRNVNAMMILSFLYRMIQVVIYLYGILIARFSQNISRNYVRNQLETTSLLSTSLWTK